MTAEPSTGAPDPEPSMPWRALFAGLSASLVGIGLARFAYTPLIPALIDAHWFAPADVVYLGAANLAGYLGGALLGRPVARRLSAVGTLRWMMALVSMSFAACAVPYSVGWFFAWRFLSGVAGGAIMVLVASTVLPHIPGARKGLASGAIFLGLGLGIAGSGTVVPLLLNHGLRATWIGLGLICAALTALSWKAWPRGTPLVEPAGSSSLRLGARSALRVIYLQYALMAIAVVPTMVFLVDFMARGLGKPSPMAALYWVLYGAGAIVGPISYGLLADRLGARRALRVVLAVQIAAVTLLAIWHRDTAMMVASVLIGTFPPGAVPLVLHRVHEVLPGDAAAQQAAWSRATTVFALFQAFAGYGVAFLYDATHGNHALIFGVGAGALMLALLVDLLGERAGTNSSLTHTPDPRAR